MGCGCSVGVGIEKKEPSLTFRTKGNNNATSQIMEFSNDVNTRFNIESLHILLNDVEGKVIFNEFLRKEVSSENLAFFDCIEHMKHLDYASLQKSGQAFIDAYLLPDSALEINLSHNIKRRLQTLLMATSSSGENSVHELIDVLGIAQSDIIKLMATLKTTKYACR